VDSGESVIAEMLDDEAPAVCQHVWDSLPIESKVIHGMYSGAEVFALFDKPKQLPRRNSASSPARRVALFLRWDVLGRQLEKARLGAMCRLQPRGAASRPEGVPTYCSLFARIPGDWKYDWTVFRDACRKARWEGPQLLRVERVEDADPRDHFTR
jgi:hypothetical protein